ncbi:MAG: hypothetical protein A3D92_08175 [Bacteroidetes bacterium RIFCSPHIGHO2_02_FULL_44_7]|nr:MAG: hypothetical protein A3D92_08175 [Bacteroidetes bacterium RIFCSPHIGHO2_02_FULL_44_7]
MDNGTLQRISELAKSKIQYNYNLMNACTAIAVQSDQHVLAKQRISKKTEVPSQANSPKS